ncbi:MAG: hypothetical protein B7Y36_17890 [Novosphingobium sp. 28-62-57]|uniref:hypothetical protein n=1 Tax=unclassified Novosphingobium TaxID=2644732 RepID=UPI000BCF8D1A|nr:MULTISPECIES: hypothetical protein [unclassified Novosphingobium]OYW47469.1 MAG: hypothetical protein B7Z36_03160 [Novosphingobium sp. 12-63-9]OYZ08178.1 MAG: hypothetical protein B7Y36_17890 [Novosphingobium sp. 28-62-57]OZA36142.1 MAG: hypothetical protein B7X92_07530 [Novosphingobium sp. 17-62-9]HQS70046.1 hypothetical protein [Novosphingobium sp.]
MGSSTRYGLAGIAALALLAIVHGLRDKALPPEPTRDYLLGVLPNFAAAIAITFVLLSVWADQNKDARPAAARRAFRISAAISGTGLIAWELFQMSSKRLVFDPHDLGATLVGVGVAGVVFSAIKQR